MCSTFESGMSCFGGTHHPSQVGSSWLVDRRICPSCRSPMTAILVLYLCLEVGAVSYVTPTYGSAGPERN
jgi:hypothetical protein